MKQPGREPKGFDHGEHGGHGVRGNKIVLFASESRYPVDLRMEQEPTILEDTHLLHAELTGRMIGAAVEVHRELGPGLLESAYHACMCRELSLRRIPFQKEVDLPVDYRGFIWLVVT
jgi:hypothetical protein